MVEHFGIGAPTVCEGLPKLFSVCRTEMRDFDYNLQNTCILPRAFKPFSVCEWNKLFERGCNFAFDMRSNYRAANVKFVWNANLENIFNSNRRDVGEVTTLSNTEREENLLATYPSPVYLQLHRLCQRFENQSWYYRMNLSRFGLLLVSITDSLQLRLVYWSSRTAKPFAKLSYSSGLSAPQHMCSMLFYMCCLLLSALSIV